MGDLQTQLEPKLLLQKTHTAVARHFQQLVKTQDVNSINGHLLFLVHKEAIPVFLYEIWFHLALPYAPAILPAGLTDQISRGVRKISLHALGGRFRAEWMQTWDLLGGVAGIKAIIYTLSLGEVRRLAASIAQGRSLGDREETARRVEELLRLVEESDRATGLSVSPALEPLVQLCGEIHVLHYLSRLDLRDVTLKRRLRDLRHLHLDLLRRIAVGRAKVSVDLRNKVLRYCAEDIASSQQTYRPVHAYGGLLDVHPGMAVCLDLVHNASTKPYLMSSIYLAVLDYIHMTLKQAARRKCSLNRILAFVKCILPVYCKCNEERPKERWEEHPLPNEILRWWSIARTGKIGPKHGFWLKPLLDRRNLESFSVHLDLLETLLLQTLREQAVRKFNVRQKPEQFFSNLQALLLQVPSQVKMTLIKLICRGLDSVKVDLDVWPPSKREAQLFPSWDLRILRTLPTSDAKYLFNRMLAIHNCKQFLPNLDSAPSDEKWIDRCLLRIEWERIEETGDAFPLTRKVLVKMKKRSEGNKDPQERAKWATAALRAALACACLDIFQETVEWSKRFLRDPVVFPELLEIMFDSSSSSILSCLPIGPLRSPETLSELKTVVNKSHEVLQAYLDITRLIVREPHYKPYLTDGIRSLFGNLLNVRIEGFESVGLATYSEVADILLYPLIPIILDFERLANSEDPKKFNWSGFKGVVRQSSFHGTPPKATLSFLDRIAYERNQFWLEKRRDKDLEIADLPSGLPQGLPLECLLPDMKWMGYAVKFPDTMPYVASRIAEVMVPSNVMLNIVDVELAKEVLPVDSLRYAIQVAAMQNESKGEKKKEILLIWKRFSSALRGHLDQLEAFRDWLADLADEQNVRSAVRVIRPQSLPQNFSVCTYFEQGSDLDEVVEWDPRPPSAESSGEKKIALTILLCRMGEARPLTRKSETKIRPEENPLWVWSHTSRSLRTSQRESVVLSALLYLDSVTWQKKRTLSRPFPPGDHLPRYPAVYLADEFLTAVEKQGDKALYAAKSALEKCVELVPAHLLRDLVVSLLDLLTQEKKESSNYSTILSITTGLIKLLQKTDQPQLAIDAVLRVIKSLPHASSYHRQMKLLKLGGQLPPHDAKLLVQAFADFVCDPTEPQTQHQPYVKVTTIKMLAQLLADARFIPIPTAVSILQTLFNSSRNIDVRREAVLAVLRLFPRDVGSSTIYASFASMASAASGPSEREPTPEADWLAAEEGKKPLPEVAPASERPLLNLFVTSAQENLPEARRAEYMQQVLLPVLEESARQHARWIRCFLSRICLSPDENKAISSLTKFRPFDPTVVGTVLKLWIWYLPKSYLQRQRSWALAHLQQPHLTTINEKLSAKGRDWRDSPAGEHWLALQSQLQQCEPFAGVYDHIPWGVANKVEDGITLEDLTEEYIHRAREITRHPVEFNSRLGRFVISAEASLESLRILEVERDHGYYISEHYDPLQDMMERIVADIESLRTPQWVAGPYRSPTVLPSRFAMEMILLPSPRYNPRVQEPAREFERRVMELVKQCADNTLLLVEFGKIKGLVEEVNKEDLPAFALFFGGWVGKDRDTLLRRLRIDMARCALCRIGSEDLRKDDELMAMIRRWKLSSSEWVRQVGWSFDGTF